MLTALVRPNSSVLAALARFFAAACCGLLTLAISSPAQQPAQPETAQQPTALVAIAPQAQLAPPQVAPPQGPQGSTPEIAGGITEAELKQLLVGKALYLRDGYLDNSLSFNEYGHLIGHFPQGSYTLSGLQIDKVRLSKHKVTLEGARYGLHFLGQMPSEDTSSAFDRVRITPNKKVVKITIDREMVVKPKKDKEAKGGKEPTTGKEENEKSSKFWHLKRAESPATEQAQPAPPPPAPELSEADQLKASIAAPP